jgi:predicted DNA-binding transcriptional regulator AlpA
MQVLSLDQAAFKAGIVRRTLERMLAAGTGPPKVQISGRRVGMLESDLERWLNSRRCPAASDPPPDAEAASASAHTLIPYPPAGSASKASDT